MVASRRARPAIRSFSRGDTSVSPPSLLRGGRPTDEVRPPFFWGSRPLAEDAIGRAAENGCGSAFTEAIAVAALGAALERALVN